MKGHNDRYKVCVLLAAYEGSQFLEEQISTICGQLAVDVDIYVSVDPSTDGTEELLDKILSCKSNIFAVSSGQRFGSAAKNFYHLINVVDVSNYDYVAFADQDDIWLPDKLSSAISALISNDVAGFSSDVYAFWPDRLAFSLVKKSLATTGLDHFYESPGPGCSQVFTSSSFQDFQEFFAVNEVRLKDFDYHDWLIYAFYKEADLGWVISDNPRILYLQHDGNQIGSNTGLSGFCKRLKIVRSKWFRSQVAILAKTFGRPEVLSRSFLIQNMLCLRRSKVSSIAVLIILLLGY